jgi:hypothetical protein
MFGLIKLIVVLILLTGIAVYGGDIWNGIKENFLGFTNPELQRANLIDRFQDDFSDIENIVKEVNQNIDNPNFDKKTKLEEVTDLIEKSKDNFVKIKESESPTLIEKTFETLNDAKEGAQKLFSSSTTTQNIQCEVETK